MRYLFLLVFLGCAPVKVANRCPDDPKVPCASRVVCTEDKKAGCMRCYCEQAFTPNNPPPTNEDPR